MIFMNKQCFGFSAVWLVLLTGCASSADNEHDTSGTEDPLQAFAHFPDSLFEGIYWNQPISQAAENLISENFELIDTSGARTYYKFTDSTQVILPENTHVHSLKLVLRSQVYLSEKERLLSGFERASVSARRSHDFSVFDYDLSDVDFKLTAFIQKDFIRLNFEQRMSK
jgi:hypothetical protein